MKVFGLIAAALALSSVALAADAFFSGDLDPASPTFNRPVQDGAALSGVGTAVRYDVQPFWVDVSGTYVMELGQPLASPTPYDPFILIYSTAFDPNSPLTNFVAGDDDYSGVFALLTDANYLTGSLRRSKIESVTLTALTQYFAISTTFGNDTGGPYDAAIGGGQGNVYLGFVPEPASLLLVALGGLALRRR